MKSYEELIKFKTYEDRLNYLKTDSSVGEETFGFNRFLNQSFYNSKEWKRVRDQVIVRDNGCDMALQEETVKSGIKDHEIRGKIFIHHINPITKNDLKTRKNIFDLNNLVCVSEDTHNKIHYGKDSKEEKVISRFANDTCPWKV